MKRTKFDKLRYISSFAIDTEHLQVNTSFLIMLNNLYESVIYHGSKSSQIAISKIVNDKELPNTKKKSLFVVPGNSRLSLLLRYIWSAIQNISFVLRYNNDILFYNFNNIFSLKIINFLNRILHRKIVILCHGELELIRPDISKGGILQRVLTFFSKSFFNKKLHISDGLTLLVLGDSIKQNLMEFIPKSEYNKIFAIDHPYISPENNSICKDDETISENNKLQLGTVGSLNEFKGVKKLIELAELVKTKSLNIELSVVGRVYYPIEKLQSNGILLRAEGNRAVPTDKYQKYISDLDFILFLYDPKSYKMTASGAIFDSIIMRKPLITLRNDYFDYLINKYNIPAIVVDSIEEIPLALNNFNSINKQALLLKFLEIQKEVSPQFQTKYLYNILKEIQCL